MLTMEARKRSTSYQFSNQMVNVGWVAGWLERTADRRSLIVHQGSRKEFGIPIQIKEGETIRPGYKDGSPIKVTCRITGHFNREKGERIVVLRALDMDNPTVLDMQPYERRGGGGGRGNGNGGGNGADHEAAQHAHEATEPAAEGSKLVKPKTVPHRVLLPNGIKAKLSGSANFFRVAGYVGGVAVEPGKLREDGRPGEPCLIILLRQDDNPDNAIPIRCYNRLAEAIADKLPIGIPIIINDGEVKIRVVPTGEPAGADGVEPYFQYPYIKARVPKIASQDHILTQPKWAEEMLKEHLKARGSKARRVRDTQAEGVAPDDGAGVVASAAGGKGGGEPPSGAPPVAAAAAPKPKESKSLGDIAPE